MRKVFIIHGFNGGPNGGWRPWIMGELAKKDIYACALPMPAPSEPEKNDWIKTIANAVSVPTEEIFLVGHSLGVPAILCYLQTLNKKQKIGGAILVSGPAFKIKRDGYEKVNAFLETPFDFEHLKNVCKNFTVIHGDDDRMVPFSDAEYLAKNLSCNLISVPGGRHLNGDAGWYKLPPLLESLEKMF